VLGKPKIPTHVLLRPGSASDAITVPLFAQTSTMPPSKIGFNHM
jgi:hypothetical protein